MVSQLSKTYIHTLTPVHIMVNYSFIKCYVIAILELEKAAIIIDFFCRYLVFDWEKYKFSSSLFIGNLNMPSLRFWMVLFEYIKSTGNKGDFK